MARLHATVTVTIRPDIARTFRVVSSILRACGWLARYHLFPKALALPLTIALVRLAVWNLGRKPLVKITTPQRVPVDVEP